MKSSKATNNTKTVLVLAGCLPMAIAFSSQAENRATYQDNGWFVGMNIGKGNATIDSATIRDSLVNSGFTVSSIDQNSRDEGYKLYVGYQWGPYFALEGGYFDLGDYSFLANTSPVSDFTGKTGLKGWNLDLVGVLPVTERFSVLARIGATQNRTKTRFSSNGLIDTAAYNHNDSYTKHKYGLGLQYNISAAFTVRLEAERYRMDDLIGNNGDLDLYSLGLVYRFGAAQSNYAATTAPEPAATPAPVQRREAAPVTQAEVTPEPVVLVLEDVHFNFDTAELNTNTQAILRQHVQTLKANPDAKVRIAGYTSASGSKAHNQALSERRAESIKAFLVQEGIAANRFRTIGYGESNPAQYEAQPSALHSDAAKANMRGLFEIIVE